MNQTVYIVGAGPGDPDLLTQKAYQLLTEYAEVVVYDRLIPDELLALIPDSVERIYAGKSCKKHHMTQDEINACLVEHAQKGKKVVRLKGGDPLIFGRGSEEALHLAKHDILSEIIPGISAASAIAARYNIPLTHRGVATSVRFITGHQQNGEPVVQDWQALANPECTLVIYMGLTNLDTICQKLMQHGMPANIPAVVVENGTCKNERAFRGTVGNLYQIIAEEEVQPPSLVIIGRVVAVGD